MSSNRTVLRTGQYSIYANGDVYVGSSFRFTLVEDRIFDYVWSRASGGKKLTALIEGYPDSFGFLYRDDRPLEKMDKELVGSELG